MFTLDTNIRQIMKYVVVVKKKEKHLFGDNLQQLRCRKSPENWRNINPVVHDIW